MASQWTLCHVTRILKRRLHNKLNDCIDYNKILPDNNDRQLHIVFVPWGRCLISTIFLSTTTVMCRPIVMTIILRLKNTENFRRSTKRLDSTLKCFTFSDQRMHSHRMNETEVKIIPYSLPSVGPGVQAVSPRVTLSHPPGARLPLLSARLLVTFPTEKRYRP